jgi:hypothetical protein
MRLEISNWHQENMSKLWEEEKEKDPTGTKEQN